MKKWILFDVDDVLVSFRQSMSNACRAIHRDVHWTKWTSYNHLDIYGFESEDVLFDFMRDSEVLENSQVEPGVKNVLQILHTRGYSIGLITARGWHPNGITITNNMVKNNELAVDKIVLSPKHSVKKSTYINQFDGEIVAYLDDSISHVRDFIDHDVKAFILNRPWNVDDMELPRVNSILEFLGEVDNLERQRIPVSDMLQLT